MIRTRYFVLILICTIAFMGFCVSIPGIYFEGGSDIYSYHVIKGNFTSTPLPFFSSFGFYAFSSEIYAGLFRYCPNIPWFDIVVFLNLTLATALLLILWRITRFHWVLLVFFGIAWLDNILLPELTKDGFWIAFLSLHIFFLSPSDHKKLRIAALLLFIYSFMIRAESSYLALVCFVLYEVVSKYKTGRASLLITIRKLIPFSIVAIAFYFLLNTSFTEQDKQYLSFRPYQFTLWDFKQDPSTILLKSSSDSAILMASENRFISDVSKINNSFFEKIHLRAKDKKLTSMSAYFEKPSFLAHKVLAELNSAKYYLAPLLIFTIVIWFFISWQRPPDKQEKQGFVLLSCIFLVSFFCVFMKLERHLVFPLITGAVLYMIASGKPTEHIGSLRFVLIALASSLLWINIYTEYRFYRSNAAISDELCKDVNVRYPRSVLYIDLFTMVSLHEKLFEKDLFPYERSVSFDNAIISYYPEWRQKMNNLGQPNSIPALAKKFNFDSEGIIFIFNKGREHLFENYFLFVYGEKVIFKEVPSPFSLNRKYPYSYYQISKSDN